MLSLLLLIRSIEDNTLLSPRMACMQELQEQIPVIATDGVYAGIAGANSCEKIALRNHRGNS